MPVDSTSGEALSGSGPRRRWCRATQAHPELPDTHCQQLETAGSNDGRSETIPSEPVASEWEILLDTGWAPLTGIDMSLLHPGEKHCCKFGTWSYVYCLESTTAGFQLNEGTGKKRPLRSVGGTASVAMSSHCPSVANAEPLPADEDLPEQPVPMVPGFDKSVARGSPSDWNKCNGIFIWSRKTQKFCPDYAKPQAKAEHVLDFLSNRPGSDGIPVSKLLGSPVAQGDCWFRCEWRGPGGGSEAVTKLTEAGWVRAWHGCKIESVYSILYHGRLCESRNRERGDRFFDGAPGVYLHKDRTHQKAEGYTRFVPLFGDGAYYASVFEVYADRSDKIHTFNGTDQWINRSRSVKLGALWLCCRTKKDMLPGDEVALAWDPTQEANPASAEWVNGAQDRRPLTLGDCLVSKGPRKSGNKAQGQPEVCRGELKTLQAMADVRDEVAEVGVKTEALVGIAPQEMLMPDDLTPRALEVVRHCTHAFASAHGRDTEKGFSFTAEKLKNCGLRSVKTLATALDDRWPRDGKNQLLLPGTLRGMLRQDAAAVMSLSPEDSDVKV